MDGDFPEQFKCPICFEIPEKEIYQCENGHTICDKCVKGIILCPQCNVKLSPKNIRNRALEDLLDMMKFNCAFKSEGCSTKITRQEISNHFDTCNFGGGQVPLCKYLGYPCKYKLKTRNLHESLQHLKQEHSILSKNDTSLEIRLGNAKSINPNLGGFWKPILLNVHCNHYMLVAYLKQGNFSFAFIWIGGNDNSKADAKFRITSQNKELPTLEWTTKPISGTEYESALQFPPLLVSLKSLINGYIHDDVLQVEVVISDTNSSAVVCGNAIVELDSYTVLLSTQVNELGQSLMSKGLSLEDMTVALLAEFGKTSSDVNSCNVCRIMPIRGPTYKCLQCRYYNLCSACMGKKEHSFHHFTFLCTFNQVSAMNNFVARTSSERPFLECDGKNNLATGYTLGSIYSDAMDLRCQKCENQPDFICLQCRGPHGLCGYCFIEEFKQHKKSHFFVITMTDSARQFALYVLRKHNVLSYLKYELQR